MRTAWALSIGLLCVATAFATDDVPIVAEEAGEFTASALAFESRIQVEAPCKEAYATLTEYARLSKLVPHLHGKATVPKGAKPGDTLSYEFERADGTKNSGRFVLTTIEEGSRVQVLVQPDHGPWLRVQEFRLYAPAAGPRRDAECHVAYEETYNPKVLRNVAYNMKEIVEEIRQPYMEVILRRLKNISEGKEAGPKSEVEKLREVARHFP